MCWIGRNRAGIVSLLFLFWRWKKEKNKVRVVQTITPRESSIQEKDKRRENKKSYVRIQVIRNEKRQINILCMDLEGNELGKLLAVYDKAGGKDGEYQNSNTLHLEQLFVTRRCRRKGIGKVMFQYLLNEMKKVEQEEGMKFRYIYGEVGNVGKDNPRVSLPFYEEMGKLPYGEDGVLCYQYTKKKATEEYDRFTYYINQR